MPTKPGWTWVRCEVPKETKAFYRRVAQLLGWKVPGVEAFVLGMIAEDMSPDALAHLIHSVTHPVEMPEEGEQPV